LGSEIFPTCPDRL